MSNTTGQTSSPSPTKLALRKIRELKQQLAEAENGRHEGIAIVSMACRFPRHSDSPEAYWESLAAGTDEVDELPPERWDLDSFFDADPDTPGRMYTRRGAFLDSIDQMDADFFGISPREATWIDPQQRVLLEVSWEALERAGWPTDVVGKRTGVFVGWMHNDYQNECSDSLLNLNPYIATGSAGSFLCGRLSYQLGLQGPSLAVDTACSSSLVALHLACQSLYRGECDRALVGGVNVMASPKTAVLTCKLKALSPGGNSRAFDARADGYVRGEGCGVVTLRRLSDAQRDGDSILAVIRGSAITHNGSSSGLTAPNPEAQERVIRDCLRHAGIDALSVDYLEAHGTGTELGDPIEMRSAAAVLAEGRDPGNPLLVGSVKTNIGHLEAAAGVAGLIKTVLAIQHGQIPPHLHFEQPNPHIPWDELPVKIVCEPTAWPVNDKRDAGKRVAGVSAFGMSGTNAHAVLESAPPMATQEQSPSSPQRTHNLLVLSGKTDEAVQQLAGRYRQWLGQHPDADLADVCHTAGAGRGHFERRAAMVVDSAEQADGLLTQLEKGGDASGLYRGAARSKPKVAWQFTGQGSQYVAMARELYQSQPVFREVLDRCDQSLRQWREGSLLSVMFKDETLLNQTTWTQPALFAVEVGLAELLKSWGLRPDVVLGHSVGQFAAACVAGSISWEDGLWLISERSRLTGALPEGGAMAAVFLPAAKVDEFIVSHANLSVAAANGSHSVISGPEQSILAALATLTEDGVRCKRLSTSHAFHSALMDPVMDEWQQIAGAVRFRCAEIPMICNVSGKLLDADRILDGHYWGQHLRQPVQFGESVGALAEFGCDVVLELGPQPTLTAMAASCWPGTRPSFISSLRSDQDDTESILNLLARLYVHGAPLDFIALDQPWQRKRIELPTYPFQRQRFWGPAKPQASQAERDSQHPLLGEKRRLAGVSDEVRYENRLAPDNPRWLDDHKVFGDIVFPGAGYVEMALAATGGKRTLHEVTFEMPLRLSKPTSVQTIVRLDAKQPTKIEIHSTPEQADQWTRNFTATVSSTEPVRPNMIQRAEIAARCPQPIEVAEFYDSVYGLGLQYGRQFQTIRELHCGEGEVLAKLQTANDLRGYLIPPVLMDGAFQSLAVGLLQDAESSFYLPVGMESLECFGSAASEVWSHAEWRDSEGDVRTADLTLFDEGGTVIARIEKLRLRPVRRAALRQLAGSGPERLLYSLDWQNASFDSGDDQAGNWFVVRPAEVEANAMTDALTERGQHCIDVQLRSGSVAPELNDASCSISGDDPEQWVAVLNHYFPAEQDARLDGVIWLTGSSDDSLHPTDLAAATKLVCGGILGLLQALRQTRMEQFAQGLRIITQGGVATNATESVSPQISQYWGLGRVVSAEYPGLRCRLIDVDDLQASTSSVVDLVLTDSHENQIALRSGQANVARLVPKRSAPPASEFAVDPDACYLITGGLGMLGRQAARWLARRGASHVVLVSRREPTDSTREIIAEIEQTGCHVHVQLADVSRREDVSELFARIKADLPPLKGVIHASGLLDDGLMAEQSWSRFEAVLAPKQSGAMLLHEMTAEMPLDFFVLYSSAASILGSPGQGNYATANAFLDGLAVQRAAAGLPALSVNWGPWNEGMAASETVVRSLALQGLTPLTSDESHQVLEQLIVSKAVQATVLDVDWRRLRRRLSAYALPILDIVAPDVSKQTAGDSELVEKLRSLQEGERTKLLTVHVQNELQQILSLSQPPAPETPLAELGLDSLMAVELSTRLQLQLEPEITISPTIAFDYPSAVALTEHLLSLLKELPEVVEPTTITVTTERDDVAIIGLSCRFPGAENAQQFWRNLRDGIDAIGELPADRWDVNKYYSRTPAPGKMYTRQGGFLPSIADFDADFFGISPSEACWIDPQHRLLMEVSWEALEDAGIAPHQTPDPRVGVFMGIMSHDYAQLNVDDDLDIIDGFRGAGLSHSAGVGRLSYMFGFEGPSIAIDSASSSSLVAVCQASKSLLESECNVALAGGVNAILTPTNSLLLCKAGMLSTDGRCKSFSAAADGFGRGEGCGVVVLKRRRDAERDGDRILAVIRGSAISHNGYSGSLTAPSGRAQERVIREALEHANINPADVDYLEAHGTGTELGDPIEMGAAAAVLGKGRSKQNPLLVGSVKANIGHLEAAAGISGLIKVVLSMQQGLIPRQLHFEQPSPHIAWDRIPVKMVVEPTQWPNGETRTASVTALGMSGTNAHVVLESVAANHALVLDQSSTGDSSRPEGVEPRTHHLLVLSAKTDSGLTQVAKRYGDWFEESAPDIADACHTAAVGRKHWQHRAAIVVESADQATQLLRAIERGESASSLIQGQVCKSPKIAWMFSGEGSEYVGMGQNLYRTQPVFRAVVDRCDEQLWQDREGSLLEALFRDQTLLVKSTWRQPALFVLQAALAKLWQSWGVEPDIVLGDGLGQYAAACAAGVMTWEDGLRLVARRSRIMAEVPANAELVASAQHCESTASPELLDEFEQFADTFDYFPADRPLICNLSGDVVPVHRLLGGSHWKRHLAESRRFEKSVQTLSAHDCTLVLELGPDADLSHLAAACWTGKAPHFMPSMCRGQNETQCVLTALGQIYVNGIVPDFHAFDAACPRRKIQLPSYPFQRSRYWITDVSKYVNEKLHQRTSSPSEDQE